MQTIDINTSDQTVDGTPPGVTFFPLRYTTTRRDSIRVGVWSQLRTIVGGYRLSTVQGLDIETVLASTTSDAERAALVGEVVLGYPGVTAILEGPTVTVIDESSISIFVRAQTVDGPVDLAF